MQQKHVMEISRRNKVILLSDGPSGVDSKLEKRHCALKQTADIKELEDSLKKKKVNHGAKLSVLCHAVSNLDALSHDYVSTGEPSFSCLFSALDSLAVTRKYSKNKTFFPAVVFRSHWDRVLIFTRWRFRQTSLMHA